MRHTAALLILTAASLHAQQPPQPAPTGATITGTIYCADTGRPARFAHVSLVPATIDEAAVDQRVQTMLKTERGPQRSAQQIASLRSTMTRVTQQATENSTFVAADLAGRYTISGVAPGVYYLHIRLDGYADALDQFTLDQVTSSDPDTARGIAALVQRITVIGNEQQTFDVRIDRGASLTGRVLYDDGAPAVGWNITATPEAMLHRKALTTAAFSVTGVAGMSNGTTTDDLGNFRIRGLAPGTYGLVVAMTERLTTNTGRLLNMRLFSGDTFHAAEAKTYALTAGATRDVVLTIPLNKVHNIRGFVVAKSDGHNPNRGSIRLASPDDPSFISFTQLAPDGSFQFDEVPAGAYTLETSGVSDAQTTATPDGGTSSSNRPVHTYGQASLPITLNDADLTGITLTVPEIDAQPQPANPSQ